MSEAEDIRIAGIDLQQELDGVLVQFRGQSVTVTIDEGQEARAAMKGIPALEEASHVCIEIKRCLLTEAPKPGESFRRNSGSGSGLLFRIESVTRNGPTFRCMCSSDPET